MKLLFTRLILLVVLLSTMRDAAGQIPSGQWIRAIGFTPSKFQLDGAGNILATGSGVSAYDDWGNTPLQLGPGHFLGKFDASGTLLWQNRILGEITTPALIASDAGGNSVMAAGYQQTLWFSWDTPSATRFSTTQANEAFLARFDAAGSFLWARNLSGGTYATQPKELTVDAAGNIYLTGQTSNRAVVTKYNAQGIELWSYALGMVGCGATGEHISVDPVSGDIFLVLSYCGFIQLGNQAFTARARVSENLFLRMSQDGAIRWIKPIRTTGVAPIQQLAADAAGDMYIVGNFSDSLYYDNQRIGATGFGDPFILKYSTNGTVLWQQIIRGTRAMTDYSSSYVQSIDFDANNNVHVGGGFIYKADVAGTRLTTGPASRDLPDLLFASFTPQGTLRYARREGLMESEGCAQFMTWPDGSVGVLGIYYGITNIAGMPLSTPPTPLGQPSFFFARFNTTPLATRPQTNSPGLAIYPNPVSAGHLLNIELAATTGGIIRLLNPLGQVVRMQPLVSGKAAVNVAGLAAGRYVVQVQTTAEVLTRGVVIE